MRRYFFYAVLCVVSFASCNQRHVWKNSSLSAEERAEDLLKQLTLEEKVMLMMDVSKPIDRLGIRPYNWWNEALHGVARSGLATVYPQPIGLAATFDPQAIREIYESISDEARAKNTAYVKQNRYDRYQGLTFWTPTVNILRDPRWGRGIETYGEDPYLTSIMGLNVVKGLQCLDKEGKYNKLHACAKHFAVHSGPEWNRHEFDANNIDPRELYETYLAPFETLVKEGDVKEVMCAYNRFEGEACCGSTKLLTHILRNEWGYKGLVVSDCSAITDLYRPTKEQVDKDYKGPYGHGTHKDAADASASAVLSGTDLECGGNFKDLIKSINQGLIQESDIDISVRRLLKARFELGEMDPIEEVSWSKIPYSVVACDKHDIQALDIARKSMTLLMNKNKTLPLKRGGLKIAVMGPNANDSIMQWGNYNGIPRHTVTILDGIRQALNADDSLIYEQACGLVDDVLMESVYSQLHSNGRVGLFARYWNNSDAQGEPVATVHMNSPFALTCAGATVFAPGVNLTNFSASYQGTFQPKKSGEVIFNFFYNGNIKLLIDGIIVKEGRTNHGSRNWNYTLKAEKGKKYDIDIQFSYRNADAQINFDLGVMKKINFAASVNKVKDADVVVFVGGISPRLEGEEMSVKYKDFKGGDRTDIQLPKVQRQMIKALKASGKKVIFINCSGSAVALTEEMNNSEAILQAWYPGQQGGTAVADVLFGNYNPGGKLPMTFYRDVTQILDFEDYNLVSGHTYRYFKGQALFPFGYGLSYTTFSLGVPVFNKKIAAVGETVKLTVPVTNTGKMDGDETIQLYLKKMDETDGPRMNLRAFKRVHIPVGKTVNVDLKLTPKQLEWWDTATNSMRVMENKFKVFVGTSSDKKDLREISLEIK